MGQKYKEDKIGVLSHSGGTITLTATSANPSRFTIGGQQYKITSSLTVLVGTATANTLYYIYATASAGVVSLQKSTVVNSIGPGTSSWKLVGAFYTAAADTWGSFVTIEGVPTSDNISYTPIFTGLGSVTSIDVQFKITGNQIYISGRFTPGTGTATEARISIPSTWTINSTASVRNRAGHLHTLNTQLFTRWNLLIRGSDTYMTIGREIDGTNLNPNNSVNGDSTNLGVNIQTIQAWLQLNELSNTPLKDL